MSEHATAPPQGIWAAMAPEDADRWGQDILDPEARRRWCMAILWGGLPYLWTEVAKVPRRIAVDRLDLSPGRRVLVVGEAVAGIGFDEEVRRLVGSDGEVVVWDLRDQVLEMMRAGDRPQWRWNETAAYADGHFDAVFVAQAVSHAGDWAREGAELLRVLKPGRPIVLAEIMFAGAFFTRARADVHLEYWVRKMLEGIGETFDTLVGYDQDELVAALGPQLEGLETFAWRGVELLWGRKPEEG